MTYPPGRSTAPQRGFSLVEVAVVLVVIGLILAAVLQGRQLIASAEYKSLKGQISEYRNAFFTFRDRYSALPGDFDAADTRLGLDGSDNGNGNGLIDDGPDCVNAGDESCLAWQHLRAADMIRGNPELEGSAASPTHSYSGRVASFFTGSPHNTDFGHKMLLTGLPAEVARRYDADVDDQQCDEGRVAGRDASNCLSGDSTAWPDDAAPIEVVLGL